jgi:subtilisin family serine protease
MRIAWMMLLVSLFLTGTAEAQVDQTRDDEKCNIPLLCGDGPRIQFEIKIKPKVKAPKPKVQVKSRPKVEVVVAPKPKTRPKPVPAVIEKPVKRLPLAKPKKPVVVPVQVIKPVEIKKPVRKMATRPAKPAARPPVIEPSWLGLPEIPVVRLQQGDLAPIQDQYILTLNLAGFAAQGLDLATIAPADLAARLGLAPTQLRSVQRRFMLSAVINATPQQAAALSQNPLVAEFNNDTRIKAAATKRRLSWGLDRMDAPTLPLDGKFERVQNDKPARLYLFDTAVDDQHPDLARVITQAARFVAPDPKPDQNAQDNTPPAKCREHGTEMASLVAGSFTGTAPRLNIVSLVVLPCGRETTGAASSILEAGEWLLLREEAIKDKTPIIANMSLAGERSKDLNRAVQILSDNGVVVVVAAGNEGKDACRYSPASAPTAITVAATTASDGMPAFSNRGSCVDIYAPGRLLTAITENEQGYVAINGTSGSAAMVSGVLARALATRGVEAANQWLASASVPSQFWRQDKPDQKLMQVSNVWRKNCRVALDDGATLRIDPRSNAQRLAVLARGSLVEVKSTRADWVEVTAPGGFEGWISASSNNEDTLRAIDSDARCQAQ